MAISAEQEAVRRILRGVRNPTILELGAHCGEDEQWIREACSEPAIYVLVEPDIRNAQMIISEAVNWWRRGITPEQRRIIVGAVDSKCGERMFYRSSNEHTGDHGSGSLRMPTGHLQAMPWIKFLDTTVVPCYTVDEIFRREWLNKIDLLWADIQGQENCMIAGGQRALAKTRYLFMEAELERFYDGQSTRSELIAMLPGWSVVEEFECNILMRNDHVAEPGRLE